MVNSSKEIFLAETSRLWPIRLAGGMSLLYASGQRGAPISKGVRHEYGCRSSRPLPAVFVGAPEV